LEKCETTAVIRTYLCVIFADYEADEYSNCLAVQVENRRQVKERSVDTFQCL